MKSQIRALLPGPRDKILNSAVVLIPSLSSEMLYFCRADL